MSSNCGVSMTGFSRLAVVPIGCGSLNTPSMVDGLSVELSMGCPRGASDLQSVDFSSGATSERSGSAAVSAQPDCVDCSGSACCMLDRGFSCGGLPPPVKNPDSLLL